MKVEYNIQCEEMKKEILMVRFSDLDRSKELCLELLNLAQQEDDPYSYTFAHLYLFDYYLATSDNEEGHTYLRLTQTLCQKYHYDDLLLTFHNLAGLFYQGEFDEQAALLHYLQGLSLIQKQKGPKHDPIVKSKFLNNIGICFHRRHDNPSAMSYFHAACKTVEHHISEEVKGTAVNFLCNLVEAYQGMGRIEESKTTIQKAEALHMDDVYSHYHIAYVWCRHYALCNEAEKCIQIAQQLLDDGICDSDHIQFKIGACMILCECMLKVNCQPLALRFLETSQACCSLDNPGDLYNCLILKTKYYECFGSEEECDNVYQEFYKVSSIVNEINDSVLVKNVLSKIKLTMALHDQKSLLKENAILKNNSHFDELTKLYNRRYLEQLQLDILSEQNAPQVAYIMLDIDYFKEYNDFYGHFKGDEAIQCVADIIKDQEHENVYACRYGGDEFLVLCINWSDAQVEAFIEAIQQLLKDRKVAHETSRSSTHLTLSIGYSNRQIANKDDALSALKAADDALYKAKEKGRNCFQRV